MTLGRCWTSPAHSTKQVESGASRPLAKLTSIIATMCDIIISPRLEDRGKPFGFAALFYFFLKYGFFRIEASARLRPHRAFAHAPLLAAYGLGYSIGSSVDCDAVIRRMQTLSSNALD